MTFVSASEYAREQKSKEGRKNRELGKSKGMDVGWIRRERLN